MSSVESIFPMFGVSGVVFHGSGFRHIGIPATICCAPRPTGGNTSTSHFPMRLASFATTWVLMYSYGILRRSNSIRHQPSSCVPSQVWM
jgi:hypothetical protein